MAGGGARFRPANRARSASEGSALNGAQTLALGMTEKMSFSYHDNFKIGYDNDAANDIADTGQDVRIEQPPGERRCD